jgi:Entner-Doudoroff aldolase
MDLVLEAIAGHGIVPVVVLDDGRAAPALVEALSDGGLPVAEFTFRTPAAVDAIRRAAAAHPDALVGAGSVSEPEQVDAAVDAGARFIVSAGLDEEVVERTLARGVAALPGCATASELMRARRLGLDCVKFFPAEQLGGQGKLGVIKGGPADNTIGSDRTDGMLSQVEPTEIEVITYPDFANWNAADGQAAAETLLAQNADLNAIFCENDSMCLGAKKAIEDQGLADKVFVVGVDGEKAALEAIMEDGVYKATGLNNSDQIGRAGFNRLMAILAGAQAEKDTVLPSPLITIDNVVRFYNPDSVF